MTGSATTGAVNGSTTVKLDQESLGLQKQVNAIKSYLQPSGVVVAEAGKESSASKGGVKPNEESPVQKLQNKLDENCQIDDVFFSDLRHLLDEAADDLYGIKTQRYEQKKLIIRDARNVKIDHAPNNPYTYLNVALSHARAACSLLDKEDNEESKEAKKEILELFKFYFHLFTNAELALKVNGKENPTEKDYIDYFESHLKMFAEIVLQKTKAALNNKSGLVSRLSKARRETAKDDCDVVTLETDTEGKQEKTYFTYEQKIDAGIDNHFIAHSGVVDKGDKNIENYEFHIQHSQGHSGSLVPMPNGRARRALGLVDIEKAKGNIQALKGEHKKLGFTHCANQTYMTVLPLFADDNNVVDGMKKAIKPDQQNTLNVEKTTDSNDSDEQSASGTDEALVSNENIMDGNISHSNYAINYNASNSDFVSPLSEIAETLLKKIALPETRENGAETEASKPAPYENIKDIIERLVNKDGFLSGKIIDVMRLCVGTAKELNNRSQDKNPVLHKCLQALFAYYRVMVKQAFSKDVVNDIVDIEDGGHPNVHLAALESIMYYQLGALEGKPGSYIMHSNCLYGKDRTQLVMQTINLLNRQYDQTGQFLPKASDAEQVKAFKERASRLMSANHAPFIAAHGMKAPGCHGCRPKMLPKYYGEIKKRFMAPVARFYKGWVSRRSRRHQQKKDEMIGLIKVNNINVNNWVNKLKSAIQSAVTNYIAEHEAKKGAGLFHGNSGMNVARFLKSFLDKFDIQNGSVDYLFKTLQYHIKSSGRLQHSLSRYIVVAINKDAELAGIIFADRDKLLESRQLQQEPKEAAGPDANASATFGTKIKGKELNGAGFFAKGKLMAGLRLASEVVPNIPKESPPTVRAA